MTRFYSDATAYWEKVDATDNGMLGGFSHLTNKDSIASLNFIHELQSKYRLGSVRALDCGAGIGRVSKQVLLKKFDHVDLLEPCKKFLDEAAVTLAKKDAELKGEVGEFYNIGMQEFRAVPGRNYDLIWSQWVIGHLTDDDFVTFLEESAKSLSPHGFICLKDNVARTMAVFDDEDSSVTRTDKEFKHIFERAKLALIKEEVQPGFPAELFPVKTFALQPLSRE